MDPSGRCPEGHLVAPPTDPAFPTPGEAAAADAPPSATSSDAGDTTEGIDELAALEQAVGRPAAEGAGPDEDLDPVFARFAELMREREPEPEAGEDAPFTIWDGDDEDEPAGQTRTGPDDEAPPAAATPSAGTPETLFPPRSAAVAPPAHAAPPPEPPAQAPPAPVPPPPPAGGDAGTPGPGDDPRSDGADRSDAPTDDRAAADQAADKDVDASTGEAPADADGTGPPMSPLRDGWVGFTARSRPSPGRRRR